MQCGCWRQIACGSSIGNTFIPSRLQLRGHPEFTSRLRELRASPQPQPRGYKGAPYTTCGSVSNKTVQIMFYLSLSFWKKCSLTSLGFSILFHASSLEFKNLDPWLTVGSTTGKEKLAVSLTKGIQLIQYGTVHEMHQITTGWVAR